MVSFVLTGIGSPGRLHPRVPSAPLYVIRCFVDFASDLCIFVESYWDIEKYVNDFCVEVLNVGLRVNANKTKELCGSMDNITE